MTYVIRRTDGAYVAPAGSQSSYTKHLDRARTFATREAAERERCPENEHVMSADSCLMPTL
jgi:hypothetical protein